MNVQVKSTERAGTHRMADQIGRLLKPKSVVFVGISVRANSAGRYALDGFIKNKFPGEIYLVGRSKEPISGLVCHETFDDIPDGIDVAILSLPAAAVREAVETCVRKRFGSAIVFAGGFAESGGDARAEQDAIAQLATDGGLALLGPNCIGYRNYRERIAVGLVPWPPLPDADPNKSASGVTLVGQSGGILRNAELSLLERGVPIANYITTGNEAVLSTADFIEFFARDPATNVIAIYGEQIRDARRFLEAVKVARDHEKHVVLLHPGKSARARQATQSHTGSLAGDYEIMRTIVEDAGVLLADTFDAFIDCVEVLARYPVPPAGGVAVQAGSGGFCALSLDFCETVGLDVPKLSDDTQSELGKHLAEFVAPQNPLDTATSATFRPEIIRLCAEAMLADPAIGSYLISMGRKEDMLRQLIDVVATSQKPIAIAVWGDSTPDSAAFDKLARENDFIISSSFERLFRALAQLTAYGRRLSGHRHRSPKPVVAAALKNIGVQAEWVGKQLLASANIPVPAGVLAKTLDEAMAIANKIKYPVVVKAQSNKLAHKTEAGGVLLNIADDAGLRAAWDAMHTNIARSNPGLILDGLLIEEMRPKGLELVIGAKRDQTWGPVLLVGLGGVFVEALSDVRLLPVGMSRDAIVEEISRLKGAKLLRGFRGAPAVNVEAIAETLQALSDIIQSNPNISEIEINPLICYPDQGGVCALDALVVTA